MRSEIAVLKNEKVIFVKKCVRTARMFEGPFEIDGYNFKVRCVSTSVARFSCLGAGMESVGTC